MFLEVWQRKDLRAGFSDLWQIKELQTEELGGDGIGRAGGDGIEKSQRMINPIYGFVKAKVRYRAEVLVGEKEARCAL